MRATTRTVSVAFVLTGLVGIAAAAGRFEVPKQEVKVLMDEGLPVAEGMLRDEGELFPFVVAMDSDGAVRQVGASGESLDSTLARLVDGEYKAIVAFSAAKVMHPKENAKIDAAKIGFEHASGYCGDMFLPFTLPLEELDRSEVILRERKGVVFRECG